MLGSRVRRFLPRLLVPALLGLMSSACDTAHYSSDWGRTPTSDLPPSGRELPPGTAEGSQRNLLDSYAGRDVVTRAESETWLIPDKGKRIVVALLTAVAHDNPENLDMFFTKGARWGFPDRREFEAFPIFDDDGGARFIDVFRGAAARFSDKAAFTCPPLVNAGSVLVRGGAEPYWCWYLSNDHLDVIAFKLMTEGGHARIDYIGMYPERPRGPVSLRSEDNDRSPPWGPVMKKRKTPLRPRLSPSPRPGMTGAPAGLPRPPGAPALAPAPGAPAPGAPAPAPGAPAPGAPAPGAATPAPAPAPSH